MSDLINKAKEKMSGNKDKVEQGIDKGGDFVDKKTGGKHSDKIKKTQDKGKEMFDDPDE